MKKLSMEELERLTVEEFKQIKKVPITIVLDNLRSQHNIGSIFRTADAFKIEEIHLCGITATPPNREIQKTALGATESVKWSYFSSVLESIIKLKEQGYHIISIEQVDESIDIKDFNPKFYSKIAIVFGNEVHGVSEDVIEKCDMCIEIPQYGTKHSLNVSVSAGIVIWELFRKLITS